MTTVMWSSDAGLQQESETCLSLGERVVDAKVFKPYVLRIEG
jgi:hypothetical protein